MKRVFPWFPMAMFMLWWFLDCHAHGWTLQGCIMANFMCYFAMKNLPDREPDDHPNPTHNPSCEV